MRYIPQDDPKIDWFDEVVTPLDDNGVDITDCDSWPYHETVKVTQREAAFTEIARTVAYFERPLIIAGYPKSVYEAPLLRHELHALGVALAGKYEDLWDTLRPHEVAADIDTNRRRVRPDLPKVHADGGCGAGEQMVKVRSDPEGGKVWLITEFSFLYCKALGLDPWDKMKCNRWREFGPNESQALSGMYVYQVRWPNGSFSRGRRSADIGPDEDGRTLMIVAPKMKPRR